MTPEMLCEAAYLTDKVTDRDLADKNHWSHPYRDAVNFIWNEYRFNDYNKPFSRGTYGVRCICGRKLFSWYRHDYHTCECGKVSIDGGDDYMKIATKGKVPFDKLKTICADDGEIWGEEIEIRSVFRDEWLLQIAKALSKNTYGTFE